MIATLIILGLGVAKFTVDCVYHGQTKDKKFNAWYSFIALMIVWTLYYYAGLFDAFNL